MSLVCEINKRILASFGFTPNNTPYDSLKAIPSLIILDDEELLCNTWALKFNSDKLSIRALAILLDPQVEEYCLAFCVNKNPIYVITSDMADDPSGDGVFVIQQNNSFVSANNIVIANALAGAELLIQHTPIFTRLEQYDDLLDAIKHALKHYLY